ncbi:DUF2789 domain-containing protein [Alkanindiges sp. WGS2144]|uniref:DUF2789 domain-containing protein n=1 Tax=Alkanindiges sp. WGS2144 TaxID=3366808 RepID=UPI003750A0B4
MNTSRPRMTLLFEQLGLNSSPGAIAKFIETHQLAVDVSLTSAPFWNDAQRQFLEKKIKSDDAAWTIIVDQLNESLHEDAVRRSQQS